MAETGNRRTQEELEQYKKEKIETRYRLKDQKNFNGSEELLLYMQNCERAYRSGRPIISDEEWEDLVRKTGYEESFDEVVSPNGRNWVKFVSPLPSLKKVLSIDDLRKYFESQKGNGPFIVEPKLDGLTYNAVYLEMESGDFDLYCVTTRGDGLNGLTLHKNALSGVRLFGLPQRIMKVVAEKFQENGMVSNGRIEIRGEAVIDKEKYFLENDFSEDEKLNFVPRSIAGGIFNCKDPSNLNHLGLMVAERDFEKESFPSDKDLINEWNNLSKESKKTLAKYGLIKSRKTEGYLMAVAFKNITKNGYPLIFVSEDGINWSAAESLKNLKYKGKMTEDHIYFISYSVSSSNGNIDDGGNILSLVDGVIQIKDLKDFEKIYKITESFDEIVDSVDNFYGTKNGIRDYNKPRLKVLMRFACDGVVVKPMKSNIESQEMTIKKVRDSYVIPKYPKDQVAVKLETDPVRTKILKLIYTKTDLGNETVSAEIEPVVAEGGAMVKNVNLHNKNWLNLPENSWIKEGAECDLRLSMDIIPVIFQPK